MNLKKAIYNFFSKTLVQYICSYLLIFLVLFFGFLSIVRNQITDLYYKQLIVQSQERLFNMSQQFADEMNGLETINVALKTEMNMLASKSSDRQYFKYLLYQELNKYATGKTYIESIVYYNSQDDVLLSPGVLTSHADNIIRFFDDSYLDFDYSVFLNGTSSKLIYLENEDSNYLIFFPSNSKYDKHIVFFVIDQREIKQLCKGMSSAEIPAIAIADSEKRLIAGWNTEMLLPHIDLYEEEDGIYYIDNNNSLCVINNKSTESIILALVSNEMLMKQVNEVFQPIYKIFMALSSICFLLVLCSMYCTYFPLRALVHRVASGEKRNGNYLNLMEQVFFKTVQQNEQMEEKLKRYQCSMKKTILGSIMFENQAEVKSTSVNIDKFFCMEPDNKIFVVNMQVSNKIVSHEKIITEFQDAFSEDMPCVILETTGNTIMFLLCTSGTDSDVHKRFLVLLKELYQKYGCYSVVSKSSVSPMDIPALYETTRSVGEICNENPIVFVEDIGSAIFENTMEYPHNLIAELTSVLSINDFVGAEQCINKLFQIIDSFKQPQKMSEFFIRYVLTDILYAIIRAMNDCNIKMDLYKECYLETLYYCCSFPYSEVKETIKINVKHLLKQFSDYIKQKYDLDNQVRLLIDENYTNSEISITYVAEYFHISVAYASLLVKRATGLNFSEYLWMLRLEKVKELLLTTKESVDVISVKVGYLNPSSFRRKFKKELGLTPSDYREKNERNYLYGD